MSSKRDYKYFIRTKNVLSIKAADTGPDNPRNLGNKKKFLYRNVDFIIKYISLAYRGTACIRNVTCLPH